jgi:hypothetical protein
MVAATERKDDVLYSGVFPHGTTVEVKNRASGVAVVIRGPKPEKTVRK